MEKSIQKEIALKKTQDAFEDLYYHYCKLQDAFLKLQPNSKFEFYEFGKERKRKIVFWREQYLLLSKDFCDLANLVAKNVLDDEIKKLLKKVLKNIKKLSLS